MYALFRCSVLGWIAEDAKRHEENGDEGIKSTQLNLQINVKWGMPKIWNCKEH
jgi:hypothetical protein